MSFGVEQSLALEKLLRVKLKTDEGNKLFVYDDATGLPIRAGTLVKGHPTIGNGRALDVRGISQAECDYLTGNDIANTINQLDKALPWYGPLDTVRQAALGDMAVNLGVAGMLGFHNALTHMQHGEWSAAAAELRESNWYRQVGARAQRICKEIETGAESC